MLILNQTQIENLDSRTIQEQHVPGRALMESAGRGIAQLIWDFFSDKLGQGVTILCGSGNNGGDGFVIARALTLQGLNCRVFSSRQADQLSGDAKLAAESYLALGQEVSELASLSKEDLEEKLVVDALLGTGAKGEIKSPYLEAIGLVNGCSNSNVVSVDIPSGLNASGGKASIENSIQADLTVAIQALKVPHVILPVAANAGEVKVIDIGIDCSNTEKVGQLFTASRAQEILQTRLSPNERSHKGKRGHVFVVGGSPGKYGAPKLSAIAALGIGSGLASIVLDKQALQEVAPSLEEVMSEELDSGLNFIERAAALVVGPGLGLGSKVSQLLEKIIEKVNSAKVPCVLDADALNILAESKVTLGCNFILTPHPGEMARLLGKPISEIEADRIEAAKDCAEKYQAHCILKGARSVIASPGKPDVEVIPAATEVLATAGSGDVLAGAIAGLLARGLSPSEAMLLGAYLHGLAGELLGPLAGPLAGDIARAIPSAAQVLNEFKPETGKVFVKSALPGSLRC